MRITAVYADGGCIGTNPSSLGGTWAYRILGVGEQVLFESSGYVITNPPSQMYITNNYTELLALLLAAERVLEIEKEGARLEGSFFTDSLITLYRFTRKKTKFRGIPEPLIQRVMAVRESFGERLKVELLSGHPTIAELASGIGKNGYPCSPHNVRCDQLCKQQSEAYYREHRHAKS